MPEKQNSEVKRVLTVKFKTKQDQDSPAQENTAALDVTNVTLDECLPPATKSWIIDLQRQMRKDGLSLYPSDDIVKVNVKALVAGRTAVIATAKQAKAQLETLMTPEELREYARKLLAEDDAKDTEVTDEA